MSTVRAFLTPARRKAIYATLVALGAVVQTLGWLDAVQVAHWLDVASQILGVLGLLLATLNVDTTTVNGMPAEESPGAAAVVDASSPTGAVAGDGSDLPAGAPVEVTPADGSMGDSLEDFGGSARAGIESIAGDALGQPYSGDTKHDAAHHDGH